MFVIILYVVMYPGSNSNPLIGDVSHCRMGSRNIGASVALLSYQIAI